MRGLVIGAAVMFLATPAFGQPPPPAAKNAALQYLLAFQLAGPLDTSHPRSDLDNRILNEWKTIPITPEVVARMDSYKSSFEYLHRGAEISECVWPSQLNAGRDDSPLTPQHNSRVVAYMMLLRARYRFENDNPKAAIADVLAVVQLARHVQSGGTVLDHLVAQHLEAPALDILAAHVWAMDRPSVCRDSLTRWDALPRPRTAADALRTERANRIAIFQRYKLAGTSPPEPDFLGKEKRPDPADRLTTVALLAGRETEEQAVARFVAVVRSTYSRAADIAELPLAEVKDAAAAWKGAYEEQIPKNRSPERHLRQVEAGCYLVCDPYRDRLRQERMTALRVMLRGAIASQLRGDNTPTENDPYGNGPFARTVTPTGYELRTRLNTQLAEAEKELVRSGGPVVLTVHTTRPRQ